MKTVKLLHFDRLEINRSTKTISETYKSEIMKREKLANPMLQPLCLLSLIFFVGLTTARAQVQPVPFFECVEPVLENGVATGALRAWFGYSNNESITFNINDGANNFFSPNPNGRYSGKQITTFPPGFHRKSFSIVFNDPNDLTSPSAVTWILRNQPAKTSTTWSAFCGSGMMNYQGRLSVASAAANQPHDFQFQFYELETGGTPSGEVFQMLNVPVANGVFSVNLDVEFVFRNYTGKAGFLEIRVRPANSSSAFTPLSPRQRLTAAPIALNAKNAANATNADSLGGFPASNYVRTSNGSVPGNFYVDGVVSTNRVDVATTVTTQNLIVNGTITSACRAGFTAIGGGRLCVSAMQTAATFYGAMQTCVNMQARVGTTADVTLALPVSGFNYFAGQTQGWLGDYAGDNLRPTWNMSSPNIDFDGPPVNVYNGGSGGTAPVLPYRCVY